jgi:predicted transposase YdaD
MGGREGWREGGKERGRQEGRKEGKKFCYCEFLFQELIQLGHAYPSKLLF